MALFSKIEGRVLGRGLYIFGLAEIRCAKEARLLPSINFGRVEQL